MRPPRTTEPESPDSADLQAEIRRNIELLGHRGRAIREQAMEALSHAGSDATPHLLQVVEEGRARFRQRRPLRNALVTAGSALGVIALISFISVRRPDWLGLAIGYPLMLGMFVLYGVGMGFRTDWRAILAQRALSQSESPLPLAWVLDHYRSVDQGGDNSRPLAGALTRTLRSAALDELEGLTTAQRATLRRVLAGFRPDFNILSGPSLQSQRTELAIALLNVLPVVGDQRDEQLVTVIARAFPASANARRIRDAARSCLPRLQTRIEQQKPAATLLRPARPELAESTLLRPAGQADSEAEQLLRPVKRES